MAYPDIIALPFTSENVTTAPVGGATGVNKMWLAVFQGEVMRAYDEYNFLENMIKTETISSGYSFEYPISSTVALEAAWGAGEELSGGTSATDTMAIHLDARPMAAFFETDNVARMIAQWDFAADLANQAGQRLANTRDRQIAAYIALAGSTPIIESNPQGIGTLPTYSDVNHGKYLGEVQAAADATQRTDAALWLLARIEDWLVFLQENDLPTDNLYCGVNPKAFQDIRALGVPRVSATGNIAASALIFGNAPEAGQAGAGLATGFNALNDALDYMGVKIVKSNHFPFTTGTAATHGEARYVIEGDFNKAGSGLAALLWHPNAVGGLSLQGMKMDSVADVRRNTQFTVASMLKGTGILRPELAACVTAFSGNATPAAPARVAIATGASLLGVDCFNASAQEHITTS